MTWKIALPQAILHTVKVTTPSVRHEKLLRPSSLASACSWTSNVLLEVTQWCETKMRTNGIGKLNSFCPLCHWALSLIECHVGVRAQRRKYKVNAVKPLLCKSLLAKNNQPLPPLVKVGLLSNVLSMQFPWRRPTKMKSPTVSTNCTSTTLYSETGLLSNWDTQLQVVEKV